MKITVEEACALIDGTPLPPQKHLFLILHAHRFGVDYYPLYATVDKFNSISLEDWAGRLGIDYEGEGSEASREDEWLEFTQLDLQQIPEF